MGVRFEDLATAYKPKCGGGPPGTPLTSITLVKELVDEAQHGEVDAIHLYPQIVLVEKPRTHALV
jgi:hypothetical protein